MTTSIETCGRCGGLLELVRDERGQAWQHAGTADHQPVLGTPIHDADELWARLRERRAVPPAEEPEHVEYPEPEVEARPAAWAEIPQGGQRLMKPATDRGWDVEATYARGTPIGADGLPMQRIVNEPVMDEATGQPARTPTGKPKMRQIPTGPKVVDSILIRFVHPDGRRAVVFYEDGANVGAYNLAPFFEATNVTSLAKEIKR